MVNSTSQRRRSQTSRLKRERMDRLVLHWLPPQAWRRLSAGIGAKGELTPVWRLQLSAEERRFGHYLLVRRSLDETREHVYLIVCLPPHQGCPSDDGQRRRQAVENRGGLDQYEVRRWQGWYRGIASRAKLAGLIRYRSSGFIGR